MLLIDQKLMSRRHKVTLGTFVLFSDVIQNKISLEFSRIFIHCFSFFNIM